MAAILDMQPVPVPLRNHPPQVELEKESFEEVDAITASGQLEKLSSANATATPRTTIGAQSGEHARSALRRQLPDSPALNCERLSFFFLALL